jgi:hypothetical protein
VSTYGRGLWRIRQPILPPPPSRPCVDCTVQALKGTLPEDRATIRTISAIGGRFLGGRLVQGVLVEAFATPGTMVSQHGGAGALPQITLSSAWRGFGNAVDMKEPTGSLSELLVGPRGELVGIGLSTTGIRAQIGDQMLNELTEPASETDLSNDAAAERTVSPTRGRPYLELAGIGAAGRVGVGSRLALVGRNLEPGPISIAIDGVPVLKETVGESRRFEVALPPIGRTGTHRVTVTNAAGAVLDGAMFLVVSSDRERR